MNSIRRADYRDCREPQERFEDRLNRGATEPSEELYFLYSDRTRRPSNEELSDLRSALADGSFDACNSAVNGFAVCYEADADALVVTEVVAGNEYYFLFIEQHL